MRGTNKAMLDVFADSNGEEYGLLGHKTDLRRSCIGDKDVGADEK